MKERKVNGSRLPRHLGSYGVLLSRIFPTRLKMWWSALLFAAAAGAGVAFAAEAAKTSATSSAPTAAAPSAAPRPDSSVAPTASFDTFRSVSDRNIFNPNRTGRRERTTEEQPPRVDTLSVVGTMESDRGLRAFFDGSESSFRRAVRVGESVDKFKVTQISPHVVDLERDGKSLSIRVGQQLRRPEGADWELVGEDELRREAQARAAAEAKGDPSVPPPIPAGASDIEKRMRERRMKDFKK
jgi:Tfp pilus assembly protein PilP